MADPVSSVAYAIEAALRALHGDLALLLPTMALVVGIIALVITNYHQLVARFPEGGGSVAAASSAVIAYVPSLASARVPIAIGVLAAVAALTWFGHLGRAVFAVMTLGFVGAGLAVLVGGMGAAIPAHHAPSSAPPGHAAFIAVLLAFPVAMALATGVEAPSSAVAQLGQLDDRGRRRFGRITLWLTLVIVGTLTLGLTALAVHLHIGTPNAHSTQIADVARASVGRQLFAVFQIFTAVLLLAAASSSFQAGPGLLKALARRTHVSGAQTGVLHPRLGTTNVHHTPYWAVAVFFVVSALVVLAAGAHDQELVLFYAVSVFMSFLTGLIAMAKFSRESGRRWSLAMNALGALVVAFTLAVNLGRGNPIASVAAALLIALVLYVLWSRAGRPRGIAQAVVEAETGQSASPISMER
ncbi:MAG: amino acid permease [Deltaproteobacteria bacterium]|nr:MAG: amino acid permease [Deltaproteobacteria bacterium]